MASVIITRMRRFMITEVTLYVFFIPFQALCLNARTRSIPCHVTTDVECPLIPCLPPASRSDVAYSHKPERETLSGWRLHSAGRPSSFSRLTTLE